MLSFRVNPKYVSKTHIFIVLDHGSTLSDFKQEVNM